MATLPPLELDARPFFASGRQPLPAILSAINRLEPGQSLQLIMPFQPLPLYNLLRARGYTAVPQERADGAWNVLFRPSGPAP
ncbi:MAG: hypothetical protein RIQ93_1457 [Verrucomicrobiota bacterium]|jgi:uncharacterized protein (DUF2249 family)